MSATVQPFDNGEFHLDMTITPDGSFTVQAPGLAKALGFREAYDLLRAVPTSEKGSETVRTLGGEQRVGFLTESGFYRAIGQRQAARIVDPAVRASVERFQSWVYGDVLPSIRRTGSYGVPELTGPELMARALVEAQAVLTAKDEQIASLEPKARGWDDFCSTTGDLSVDDAAKVLSRRRGIIVGGRRLRTWMLDNGWMFRGSDQRLRAYQRRIDQGVLAERAQWHHHPETGEKVQDAPQVRVTGRGIEALATALAGTTWQGELEVES